jgi:hypothetical protein
LCFSLRSWVEGGFLAPPRLRIEKRPMTTDDEDGGFGSSRCRRNVGRAMERVANMVGSTSTPEAAIDYT